MIENSKECDMQGNITASFCATEFGHDLYESGDMLHFQIMPQDVGHKEAQKLQEFKISKNTIFAVKSNIQCCDYLKEDHYTLS